MWKNRVCSAVRPGAAIPPEAHKLRGRRLAKCPRTDEEAARQT